MRLDVSFSGLGVLRWEWYLAGQPAWQVAAAPPLTKVLHGARGAAERLRCLRDGQAQVEGDAGFGDSPAVSVSLPAGSLISAALMIFPALPAPAFQPRFRGLTWGHP